MLRIISSSIAILIFVNLSFGQRMIYDSLTVEFGNQHITAYGVNIDTILDARMANPQFIGVHEKKKYLFIPLDRFVAIGNPLAQEIRGMFSADSGIPIKQYVMLKINEFDVSVRNQLLSKKYVTHANFAILIKDDNDEYQPMGNLLYETSASPKGFLPKAKQGYEAALDRWKEDFSNDMIKISVCPQSDPNCQLPNLIDKSLSLRKNLLANVETAIWVDTWIIDGEIIFSRPESSNSFYRKAFCIRYRNEQKFQAFEQSISNDQFNFRLSKNFVYILKSKLFLGINLWNDNEFKDRGFEDIFILDYSLGLNITFNPYYKKGLTGGLGVLGSATYIYSEGIAVKPFLTAQIGVKL